MSATCCWCCRKGPLLAFGGEAVDAHGVGGRFPSASMLDRPARQCAGLATGAARRPCAVCKRGWRFAARIDAEGQRLTDFQTVKLERERHRLDHARRTRGARWRGSNLQLAAYPPARLRRRQSASPVALRLDPADEAPDSWTTWKRHSTAGAPAVSWPQTLPAQPSLVRGDRRSAKPARRTRCLSPRAVLPRAAARHRNGVAAGRTAPSGRSARLAFRRAWRQRTVRVRHVAAKTGLGSAPS